MSKITRIADYLKKKEEDLERRAIRELLEEASKIDWGETKEKEEKTFLERIKDRAKHLFDPDK